MEKPVSSLRKIKNETESLRTEETVSKIFDHGKIELKGSIMNSEEI